MRVVEAVTRVQVELNGDAAISDYEQFCQTNIEIFETLKSDNPGKVARYIPPLAKVNPELLGLSICTLDGRTLSLGDAAHPFCVQSCSKPITYCMAVELNGSQRVHSRVGFEPSGKHFSERLLKMPERVPHNPLVNAGSIACCSLVHMDRKPWERAEMVAETWRRLSASPVAPHVHNTTFIGEKATAHRNNCLAHMMAEEGLFGETVSNEALAEILESYFTNCSIELDCDRLAVVAATLANGGICPITSARVFNDDTVSDCLSLMMTCGLYDYSGEFLFNCGFPAKSGVSGVIMGVVPGAFGFAVFSPRLDSTGNSVRGLRYCQALSLKLPVHAFSRIPGLSEPHALLADRFRWRTTSDKAILSTFGLREMSSLWWAASRGDCTRVRQLAARGMDVNYANYDGRTALHLASENKDVMMTSLLLALGAVAKPDKAGRIPDVGAAPRVHLPGVNLCRYFAEAHDVTGDMVVDALQRAGLDADDVPDVSLGSMVPDLIVKALCGKLVIPNWPEFKNQLEAFREGSVGVAIETTTEQRLLLPAQGERFQVSCLIRPVLYSMAVQVFGLDAVHARVGREPSGEPETALVSLGSGLPFNPFVMPGVLTICAMLVEHGFEASAAVDLWQRLAHSKGLCEIGSWEDEREMDRAYGLVYMLKANGVITGDATAIVDFYHTAHALLVTSAQVASVAASLAKGGVGVIPPVIVKDVLSLMYSCGVDEKTGEWTFRVGLPAKANLKRGLCMMVVPNVMGICLSGEFSEVFDFARKFELNFNFHLFKKDNVVTGGKSCHSDPTLYFGCNKQDLTMQLIYAASKGDVATTAVLIGADVNVNWTDYDSRSAAHLAARCNKLDVLELLYASGANMSLKDRWGKTPMDEAIANGHDSIYEFLNRVSNEDLKWDNESQ